MVMVRGHYFGALSSNPGVRDAVNMVYAKSYISIIYWSYRVESRGRSSDKLTAVIIIVYG